MKTYVLVWVRPGLYCGDWVVTSVGRQAEVFDVTDRGMLRVNGPLSYAAKSANKRCVVRRGTWA